jgi:ATP/maltotriose-dependent transcriptional regulator MalT
MIKLIDSKLQPPVLSANLIKRTRLIRRLRSNLELNASFICAGPGWGKTTLTAEFLKSVDVPAVWYDVDASDSDIAVFFRYLVRAVQQADPDFGHSTLNLLSSGGGLRSDHLADLFLHELSERVDRELIVVLDNIHHTFAAEWSGRVLYRILQLLPKRVHFILLARVGPDFTFSRMRSKQAMDHIDDRALAFSRVEVAELFRDVVEGAATLDKLLERTQGWVAGLQIIRQAIGADTSLGEREIEDMITRSETEIFDYFAERVYMAEPLAIRELLMRSSLPSRLTCDVLNVALGLNVTAERLQAVVRENVFLTRLAGETDTYVYHPLFRDFLRRQLEDGTTLEQLSDMHCRLGRYYAGLESWPSALEHFFKAGDEASAARTLLAAERPSLSVGLTRAVTSYLPRFQRETLDSHPQLYNLMGEVRIIEGDSAAAEALFRSALEAGAAPCDPAVEATALAGLAHTAVREHNFKEAIEFAEAAERYARLTGDLPERAALAARIKNVAGAVSVFEGRYTEANALMEDALRLAHEAGDARLIRSISHNLALPAFMEGDFHSALRYFSRSPISVAPGVRRALHPDSVLLYLNRAAVYTALGELNNAERDLTDADELATVFSMPGFVPRIIEARANIARERRDFEEADELYASALLEYERVGSDPVNSDLIYERTLLELRKGDLDRAIELIETMVEHRRRDGRDIELALARQMRGRVLLERGDAGALVEAAASEPLLRRLRCNYYLAISCYLRARALYERDAEGAGLALAELIQLGERFDYSYFITSEEWFHPALAGLCRQYSIESEWLESILESRSHARKIADCGLMDCSSST